MTTTAPVDLNRIRQRKGGLSDLEWLVAIEEIKAVRLTFCRALDSRDWSLLRETITEDFQLYFADVSGTAHSNVPVPVELGECDSFIAYCQQFTNDVDRMIHLCTMPQIDFESRDEAQALWFMQGYGEGKGERRFGYEKMCDSYARIDGRWVMTGTVVEIAARYTLDRD